MEGLYYVKYPLIKYLRIGQNCFISFWVGQFLETRAEVEKFFNYFFRRNWRQEKKSSEIYWPLLLPGCASQQWLFLDIKTKGEKWKRKIWCLFTVAVRCSCSHTLPNYFPTFWTLKCCQLWSFRFNMSFFATMAVRVVNFSSGGYKIWKIFA